MGMEWLSGGGSCGNGRGKRMGRTPCGQTLFCQPPHFCRGGYLIRPAEELYKSAFSLAKRDSFSVWLRPARRGIVFPLAQLGPKPLFLLHCKRKSGSGLRKRKGRPVEILVRYVTTVQSPNPACLPKGFKKIFLDTL